MKNISWILLIIVLDVIPAFAQRQFQIEASAYGGVPAKQSLTAAFCCSTAAGFISYTPHDANYVAGISSGIVFDDRIRVTFGAMYMPVSFVERGTTCCPISHPEAPQHGTSWDLPLLDDYRWLGGPVRIFSGGGLIILSRTTRGPDQTPAPVVAGGIEWERRTFAIRPEIRYIHYSDRSSSNVAVQRPANQVQILIGFTFRKALAGR